MKELIDIPKELYEAYKGRPPMLGDVGMDDIAQAIANGTPLSKGEGVISYLMHKEMNIPISDCQKAYEVAIDYLRNQGKVKG